MKLDLSFEQTLQDISVAFDENEKQMSAGFEQTTPFTERGATFTPSVSSEGVISWTNDRGLPNPAPVNIKGANGRDGANGKDGADGYTPIKGTDYFTEADKAEMVRSVISALPVYNGEVTSV